MSDRKGGEAPSAGAEDPSLARPSRRERGISTGTNARPLDDTIAQTGPGVPDDTSRPPDFAPGEEERLEEVIRDLPGKR